MPPRTWATTPRATMQSICTIPASASPTVSYPHTHRVVKMAALTNASAAVVARPVFVGKTESLRARAVAPAAPKRASVVTFASAEETSRRAALSTFTVSARTPIHIATGAGRHDRSASRGKRAPRPRRRRSSRARVRTTTDDVVTGKQTLRIATATREISRRAIGALPVTPAYRSTLDSSPNLRPPVSRSPRSLPWPRTVTPPTSGVPPPTPPVRPRETQKVTTGNARPSRSVRVG